MKFRYIIAVLLLLPQLASAHQPDRTYLSSPVAAARHLPFSSGVLAGSRCTPVPRL